ncbi:putative hydrolase MhqD [compost metagenome]
MVPRRGIELPHLKGVPVFIAAGSNDRMCPPSETEDLDSLLTGAGASVTVHWEQFGHQLTSSEVAAAAAWFKQCFV